MAYKNNSSKVWNSILAVLLVLVIAGTAALVGFLSDGFKNWDKFKPDDKKEQTTENGGGPVTDENGNEMNGGEVHEMPKQMTFRSVAALDGENAYDSVTLHATVKPDDADDKRVVWAVAFKNPESEWATGKTVTDYVTVTPQSEGSSIATIKCLQPFGEQIQVFAGVTTVLEMLGMSFDEVVADFNVVALFEGFIANCTVDFAKRIKSATLDLSSGEKSVTVDAFADSVTSPFSFNDSFAVGEAFTFGYTDYTRDDTFSKAISLWADHNVFATAQAATGDTLLEIIPNKATVSLGSVDVSLSLVLSFKSDAERTLSEEFAAYNLYSRWLGENLNAGLFYFEFSFFGTYSTCTNKVPVYFTAESIEIMPTEITLDDTDLII